VTEEEGGHVVTSPAGKPRRPDRRAAEKLEAQLEARERRIERQRQAEWRREEEEARQELEAAKEKARKKAEAKAKAAARAEEQEVLSAASLPRRLLGIVKKANVVLAVVLCLFFLWQMASVPSAIPDPDRVLAALALEIVLVLFFCAVLHLVLVGIGALLDIRDDVADLTRGTMR
jgi:hypothetical protein